MGQYCRCQTITCKYPLSTILSARLSLFSKRIVPSIPILFEEVKICAGVVFNRLRLQESDFPHLTSLLDLRHIEAIVHKGVQSIPSSISNLWNIQSLILRNDVDKMTIDLPETLWRMKSLRYVKVHECKFQVSDSYELQLENVLSFSRPYLSSGRDVEWLLQRLPNVRKLSCILDFDSGYSIEESVETFVFHRKLETLKLLCKQGLDCQPYLINYPSTLIKLTLEKFELSWTAVSVIGELQYLRILKLRSISFPGPTWEMEDVTFSNLKYFELGYSNLELWNANTDSLPCLEQLVFVCTKLKELPSCFEEISSIKKITLQWGTTNLKSSAFHIREEQMELGNKVEVDCRIS